MKLRPIPDISNASAMQTLGRLSAIRSARQDAFNALRDVAAKLLRGDSPTEAADIAEARQCLDRIEALAALQGDGHQHGNLGLRP